MDQPRCKLAINNAVQWASFQVHGCFLGDVLFQLLVVSSNLIVVVFVAITSHVISINNNKVLASGGVDVFLVDQAGATL